MTTKLEALQAALAAVREYEEADEAFTSAVTYENACRLHDAQDRLDCLNAGDTIAALVDVAVAMRAVQKATMCPCMDTVCDDCRQKPVCAALAKLTEEDA